MDESTTIEQSVELLQQLGLKEYEARSFVALSRLPSGTAKQIHEISEVPRTRVYDAVRVLEAKGLVETHHSSPQQFRAVSVAEAAETLRAEYDDRVDSLQSMLGSLPSATVGSEAEVTHEVWSLKDATAIAKRTDQLVGDGGSEVVVVIGDESALTPSLVDEIEEAQDRGVNVVIGTSTDELRDLIDTEFPDVPTFLSGLEWLRAADSPEDHTVISRILLVDRASILISTRSDGPAHNGAEQAVFGRGFDNGLVTIIRRLMAT